MKNFYELWLPNNRLDPEFVVLYSNGTKKYRWNSFRRILTNATTGNYIGHKNFNELFTQNERNWIKSKFEVNKNYARALQNVLNARDNTRKDYKVVHKHRGVNLYYKPDKTNSTYMRMNITSPFSLNMTSGKTHKNLRGKGIGKQLRALATLAAKKAGFKNVTQTAVFMEPEMRKTHKYPPSSYIMKSLGFNQYPSRVSNNILHHTYNFKTKPNNTRLFEAAYPLRSHPLKK
jgi:predicted GNAT family acetyltransferase